MSKLTKQEWRDREELRLHWHDFTQCDYPNEDFGERMEAAGLVRLRPVEDDDPTVGGNGVGPERQRVRILDPARDRDAARMRQLQQRIVRTCLARMPVL